jgi:hypothetical protein
VSPDGIITTVAGTDTYGYSGDGGSATNAQFKDVTGIATDGVGNLFIADRLNQRVRKVSPDGIITTVAGGGTDLSLDGGPATSAQLSYPSGVAIDGAGNLFIADTTGSPAVPYNRIRKVSSEGIITTVAGGGTNQSLDGGLATGAALYNPTAVAVDAASNLFIADGRVVRKVSPDGIITTVAGGGKDGPGDSGPATSAALSANSVALDRIGNLFIAGGPVVRKVSPDRIITTIGGNGSYGYSGDGGPATSAELYASSVAVDGRGNIYVADAGHNVIRILRSAR